MSRRPGQHTRPKKKSKQPKARMIATAPVAEQPAGLDATKVEAGNGEPRESKRVIDQGVNHRRGSRSPRPYQHGKQAPTARLATSTTSSISKAQEFAFIRNDLRRLLITAAILIVVMIGLLILIDR